MTRENGQSRLAVALLKPINNAAIVLLGVFTVLWGLWVVSPFWSVFGTAKLYSALINFAPISTLVPPEIFWGSLAIICGTITIWGAIRRTYRTLIIGSGIISWHWTMISMFYFIGDWQNTGGITTLCFAVYGMFIYLNIKVNHRRKPSRHSREKRQSQSLFVRNLH